MLHRESLWWYVNLTKSLCVNCDFLLQSWPRIRDVKTIFKSRYNSPIFGYDYWNLNAAIGYHNMIHRRRYTLIFTKNSDNGKLFWTISLFLRRRGEGKHLAANFSGGHFLLLHLRTLVNDIQGNCGPTRGICPRVNTRVYSRHTDLSYCSFRLSNPLTKQLRTLHC